MNAYYMFILDRTKLACLIDNSEKGRFRLLRFCHITWCDGVKIQEILAVMETADPTPVSKVASFVKRLGVKILNMKLWGPPTKRRYPH